MKKYIYIILIILLIIYINGCELSNYNEKFTNNDFDKHHYDSPNMYDVLNTQKVKPIQIDSDSNHISGIDSNNNYWIIKDKFSDIYNYEDSGGEIINNFVNDIKTNTANNIVKYKKSDYKLLGTATNIYYNLYFYIYENLVKQTINEPLLEEQYKYMKNKNYQYILVKKYNNEPKIIHWISPRNKINLNDVVYLSMGSFQLGPLLIKLI